MLQEIHKILDLLQGGWSSRRVLVVGDAMLDRYIWGEVTRISPEAPIPVVRASRETNTPGGAANVAMNLAGLGVQTTIAGFKGDDDNGKRLDELLGAAGARPLLTAIAGSPTTCKTRIVGGHQHMLRLDIEGNGAVASHCYAQLWSSMSDALHGLDAIVLSDYAKGVLTPDLTGKIIEAGRKHGIPVLVGPKGRDFRHYAGAFAVCPNLSELSVAMGESADDTERLFRIAQSRMTAHGWEYLVVTMGERGLALLRPDSVVHIPVRARSVFDVSGAGDTVLATLSAAITSGVSIETAAELANIAAGIVVGKVGTVPIERHELLAELSASLNAHAEDKILDPAQLAARVSAWRASGDSIVFTNGCFDLLHVGHLSLLEAARREGSRLVVAINSDDSVRRLKGDARPIVGQAERARIIAALSAVDAVTIFNEDTPLRCILDLQPNVIVKGGDYTVEQVVGNVEARAWNGRVKIVPLVSGISTTNLAGRLKAKSAGAGSE